MIKKRKRRYVFPAPRITGRYGPDYGTDVIRWMGRVALQHLGSFHRDRQPFPTTTTLAQWIRERTLTDGAPYIVSGNESKPDKWRLSNDDLTRKTMDAAAFALLHFDPVYYDQRRAWGEDTSRGQAFTQTDYRHYTHLTAKNAASAMGCSVRTIRRLRAEARSLLPVKTGDAELDQLLFETRMPPSAGVLRAVNSKINLSNHS